MIVNGELSDVPLLDVFQVLAASKQSGALLVEGAATSGTVIFIEGAIVAGESSSTRLLLEKASGARDLQTRSAFRRVQMMACVTEVLSLREGSFSFSKHDGALASLAGVDLKPFYAMAPMPTAELLLVLATLVDKKDPEPDPEPPKSAPSEHHRVQTRYTPTLIEARLSLGSVRLSGYLTNLSVGGAFFQGATLPEVDRVGELSFELRGHGSVATEARTAWARLDSTERERGVGLAFDTIAEHGKSRIRAYLDRLRELESEIDVAEAAPQPSR